MPKTPVSKTPVIVTVTDETLADIQAVARELTAGGMTVERVMPITGVISGSAPAGRIAALEGVKGVASVEREVVSHLPPPGSDVQ